MKLAPVDRDADTRTRHKWVTVVLALLVVLIAAFAIRAEFRVTSFSVVMREVRGIPWSQLFLSLAATVACYLVLSVYDLLGLRYVKKHVPLGRSLLASFYAYAFAQMLGFSAITGGTFRLRFWSASGLSTSDVLRAATFSAVGFWVGVLSACGMALTFEPLPPALLTYASAVLLRGFGVFFLATVAVYLVVGGLRQKPWAFGRMSFEMPGPMLVSIQAAVAIAEWTFAGLAAWVLLPAAPDLSFVTFLGLFSLAQGVALASHVPGGLGVFDTLIVLLLAPYVGASTAAASMVAYRAVYYVLPFVSACALLAVLAVVKRLAADRNAT